MEEGKKILLKKEKLGKEQALIWQKMHVESGTAGSHGNLEEIIRELDLQLIGRTPDQAELQQDLEVANTQLIEERKLRIEY